MSQSRLARAMGVDRSAVSRWLSGERTPSAYELALMVAVLNVSADEVLGIRAPPISAEAVLKYVDQAEHSLREARAHLRGAVPRGEEPTTQQIIGQAAETAARVAAEARQVRRDLEERGGKK